MSDPIIKDGELTNSATHTLGQLLAAWITFRENHDLHSEELQCCDKTKYLFDSLVAFEKLFLK